MFLLSLQVTNLRLLSDVHLTFGKGLTVIYGPNDIGKSSLAEALRIAFLLPHTSIACEKLKPWGTDHVPTVVVKFKMGDAAWQITKKFAPGGGGGAILERVDESGILHEDAKGRAVEGRLREIVAWGVPAPGGRGGPRGLPESYLATALLGRQDQVTAILEASPEEDGAASGLQLVTAALGALGQDPLVGQLLERLQERTDKAFTEGGQLRQTRDSPLAQLANKVKDQKAQLDSWEERVRQSTEIERKVKALSEHGIVAQEKCRRLELRVGLLRRAREAEDKFQAIRARERSLEEARMVLATFQEALRAKEATHDEATSARSSVEKNLQEARERVAKTEGAFQEARKNTQQSRDARRAELISKRDAAARRAKEAREVIQARKQVQGRKNELTLAEQAHAQAQNDELRARNRAKLATLEAELRRAQNLVKELKLATRAREDAAACVKAAEQQLRTAEAALADAESALSAQKSATDTAQRDAAQRYFQEEAGRAKLSRLETDERVSVEELARIRAAMACIGRLAKAQNSLADVEAKLRDLDIKAAANAERTRECDLRAGAPTPMPLRATLLVGFLGGVIAAALGIGLQVAGGILIGSIVGSSVLAAGVALFVFRDHKRRLAARSARREKEELAKERELLVERRNQLVTERGVAQLRVDSVQLELDQAVAMLGELNGALAKANVRLQAIRSELEGVRAELRTLEGQQSKCNGLKRTSVEAAERQVVRLKEELSAKIHTLDAARQQSIKAQVSYEAANSSAALIDLASLEQQVNAARMEVDAETADYPEAASVRHQRAKDTLAELETGVRLARGRVADSQSSFEAVAAALIQPADEVLVEAQKEYATANQALQSLEEQCIGEAEATEAELRDAQAAVAYLEEQRATAHAEAEVATQARDGARAAHEEAASKVKSLTSSVQDWNLADAEAALTLTRQQLEADACKSESCPDDLSAAESLLEQERAQLRKTEDELKEARGQLKFVGGAVARDRRDREVEALGGLTKVAEDVELEYRAARYLLDVLKEEEENQATHLGRSLAKPVTEIFPEFTSGRYAQIMLDSGLRFQSVTAKGSARDLESLSVGTRDQLATLVRLALAAHLKSVVVLDDQLAQSDAQRLAWIRDRLRTSVRDHEHQIIVITCRPLDYLHPTEIPVAPNTRFETDDGSLTVVDLERLISCS
jgi:chromosome segregation ATPase